MDFGQQYINENTTVVFEPTIPNQVTVEPIVWVSALLLVIFLILLFSVRAMFRKRNLGEQKVFLVRLPKQRSEEDKQPMSVQQLREEIAKGESLFTAIGGLRAQHGFRSWLFGRNDHFGFEIVAHKKVIAFYVTAPYEYAHHLEHQLNAIYPDAVIEDVKDYNIFSPQSFIAAAEVQMRNSDILPLRTYLKDDTDPLNSIINAMSKLQEGEGLALQYIARSAPGSWHGRARGIVEKAHKTGSLKKALGANLFNHLMETVGDFNSAVKNEGSKHEAPQKKLTAREEEAIKAIEEKAAKAGLQVNIRAVASASSMGRASAILRQMTDAFSHYNLYEYGNSFIVKTFKRPKKFISDFIFRRFYEKTAALCNTEEMASLYHLPLKNAETPNILWLTAKQAAAPVDIPEEGLLLGTNHYRHVQKEVRVKPADRLRHTYIVGKSGTGKSQLLANMAIQDVLAGHGLCFLDPHGDVIEDILARIPPERADDVIIFSPADIARPMSMNLLEYDPRYPEQKTFVINEMIGIFDKLYDLKSTGGPIFEQYMRNAMLLVMSDTESGSTLMEIPRVLADAEFRNLKLSRCPDPTVVDFWRKEAEKAGGDAALANVVPYITSKLTSFISNDMMRPIIGQQKSSFNLRDIMDSRKLLFVSLPKGIVGELNAYLLGMIIVGKILMAALSRADITNPADRKDFYLYIDEFQNFTTDSICQILSEARKYGLGLVIAHQYIGQLTKKGDTAVKDAVFGNVGTMISFKVGSEDAEFLKKEFAPVFSEFDLINVEKYTAYIKLLIDNTTSKPFSIKTPWPLAGDLRPDMAGKLRHLSRLKYGQDRETVEAEIMARVRQTQ